LATGPEPTHQGLDRAALLGDDPGGAPSAVPAGLLCELGGDNGIDFVSLTLGWLMGGRSETVSHHHTRSDRQAPAPNINGGCV
jgi:hypothetical protein